MKKVYYTLDEASSMLGDCKPSDLVHLGANDKLPIYVLADGWCAHLWATPIIEEILEDDDNKELFYGEPYLGEPFLKSPANSPMIINGPVRLKVDSLMRFEANADTISNSFLAPDDTQYEPDCIHEYRLCSPNNPAESVGIALGSSKMVVMVSDLPSIQSHSPISPEEPLGETERKSLYKLIIGMAIGGYKYDPSKAKNAATKDIHTDLGAHGVGLDEDTIRKWLKESAQILPPPKPNNN